MTPHAWAVFSFTMLYVKEHRKAVTPPLSQERLARRADIGIKTIKRAERVGSASTETIIAIAAALGLKPGDLFEPPKRNGRKRRSA